MSDSEERCRYCDNSGDVHRADGEWLGECTMCNSKQELRNLTKPYYFDYPTEPIGGSNPYYRCVHCKVSDPQINGDLRGHQPYCEYRIKKEQELQSGKRS